MQTKELCKQILIFCCIYKHKFKKGLYANVMQETNSCKTLLPRILLIGFCLALPQKL